MSSSSGTDPFCPICLRIFRKKSGRDNHVAVIHQKEQTDIFTCEVCDKRYMSKEGLEYHKTVKHGGARFECTICGNSFGHRSALIRHSKLHEEHSEQFRCNKCDNKFGRKDKLVRHKQSVHNLVNFDLDAVDTLKDDENTYTCKVCSKSFSGSDARYMIIGHLAKKCNEGKKYYCDACEKSFSNVANLNRHKRHSHVTMSVDVIQCESCDFITKHKQSLLRHIKRKHNDKASPSTPTTANVPPTLKRPRDTTAPDSDSQSCLEERAGPSGYQKKAKTIFSTEFLQVSSGVAEVVGMGGVSGSQETVESDSSMQVEVGERREVESSSSQGENMVGTSGEVAASSGVATSSQEEALDSEQDGDEEEDGEISEDMEEVDEGHELDTDNLDIGSDEDVDNGQEGEAVEVNSEEEIGVEQPEGMVEENSSETSSSSSTMARQVGRGLSGSSLPGPGQAGLEQDKEETDSMVPTTPKLLLPRRNDGDKAPVEHSLVDDVAMSKFNQNSPRPSEKLVKNLGVVKGQMSENTLGVECRLSKEGKDKLQAGGMIIENEEIGQEKKRVEVTISTEFEEHQNNEVVKGVEVENIENVVVDLLGIPVSSIDTSPSVGCALTPDLMGFYTITLPVPKGSDLSIFSSLQEDISWFDTPVSLLCIENISEDAVLEVKFRDQDMAMAVLQGLNHKYPGLEGDETGKHADIVKDVETGLFTLCFTDSKRKRFKATMEKFRVYSKQPPVISRGLGAEQVLVAFHIKEEAVQALKENFDSEEFPELHVAPVSRG